MLVTGLMSGTSVDGIDAALVEISGTKIDLEVKLIAGKTYPYAESLRQQILDLITGQKVTPEQIATIDEQIAKAFAQAALSIHKNHGIAKLIGSHGQTIFHRCANADHLGYSWQLGRGATIAYYTNIHTISGFRQGDLALHGQGAPLVPKIDAYLLSHDHHSRCVQNIGGIGNLTYIPGRDNPDWLQQVKGWDTGPGNTLLDLAIAEFTNGEQKFDPGGQWASQGEPCLGLVHQWLKEDFFTQTPPKSTGRELFGLDYFHHCQHCAHAQGLYLSPADWLATLTELTAASIADSYKQFLPAMPDEVVLCGGGVHNDYLISRLETYLEDLPITTTDKLGISSDFKEAIAFAVLAYWRWQEIPGNLPAVTGAKQEALLGEIHQVY